MNTFSMNGYIWKIQFVDSDNPMLMDRTGTQTVATTDPKTQIIYLSNELYGEFLVKVLLHELGHCALISFDLLEEIHRVVKPKYWIEAEEWLCNFLVDYGFTIFRTAYSIFGFEAWKLIPYELDRLVA